MASHVELSELNMASLIAGIDYEGASYVWVTHLCLFKTKQTKHYFVLVPTLIFFFVSFLYNHKECFYSYFQNRHKNILTCWFAKFPIKKLQLIHSSSMALAHQLLILGQPKKLE